MHAHSSVMAMPPAEEVAPGQVLFDRYLVEWQIGSGGMGTVWKVKHKVLGVSRALKLIRPQIAFDPKTRADFRREATIMAGLHHPNAVLVHDAQIGSDLAYIEMELLEGHSIEKKLDPGRPLPLDWVTRILAQLCELLDFVHSKDIIHRDLKPSNLMLLAGYPEGREFLKVLDFGIAKSLNTDHADSDEYRTQTGGARFTPHYASPEQVGGHAVDARSDIYSVGIILYEFLTGYRPFSEPGLIYQHLCAEPPPFAKRNPKASVPAAIERVVMRCLEKDPNKRPQTASELFGEFMAAVESTGLAVTLVLPSASLWESRGGSAPGKKSAVSPQRPLAAGLKPFILASTPRLLLALAVSTVILTLAFIGLWYVRSVLRSPRSGAGPVVTRPVEPEAKAETKSEPKVVRRVPLLPGYEADPDSGLDPAGWPREILDTRTQRRFTHFDAGAYLPSDFAPVDPNDRIGGVPRILEHKRFPGLRVVRIEGGEFAMGGLITPPPNDSPIDRPIHQVVLSDYYLGETEVTNQQMEKFLEVLSSTHSTKWVEYYKDLDARDQAKLPRVPVNFVTRLEATEFAHWLGGRLPTEAEWEFAARSRASANAAYPWGSSPPEAGMCNIDSAESNVGSKIPISLPGTYSQDRTRQGIVDMAGNVREWCQDEFLPYTEKRIIQPSDPEVRPREDKEYVVRGSSFAQGSDRTISTYRDRESRDERAADLGFRIVLMIPPRMKPAAVAE
ncbi:MAG: bifunctional serine/threonine-protein kinase/formylglycine-generating enzyme family protein [Isosphaeraceae bacterium]|nr:bifunctional serine/threonine-protein kinase/formylglycine-generating enzyme family protein [Isosphaeraceae bacterium]